MEGRVQVDNGGIMAPANLLHGFVVSRKKRQNLVAILAGRGVLPPIEGLEKQYSALGQRLAGERQGGGVGLLEAFGGLAQGARVGQITIEVIDSNTYHDDIGAPFNNVINPAGIEVFNRIATDSPVHEVELQFGTLDEKTVADKRDKATTVRFEAVFPSAAVGDAVTNNPEITVNIIGFRWEPVNSIYLVGI